MPLIAQWVRQRPWLATGLAGAAGGIASIASGVAAAATSVGALAMGSISTKNRSTEHPLRRRILNTLEKHPGLCYRELQSTLATANGTLRHHLDVLQSRKSISVMPVNGRTCYFAGAPSQVEILKVVIEPVEARIEVVEALIEVARVATKAPTEAREMVAPTLVTILMNGQRNHL